MTDNAKMIRGLYEAFARGDVPAVLSGFAPEVKWTEAEGFPYGGTYVGPEAVLQGVFMRLATEWDGFAAVPADFVAEAGTVVALGTWDLPAAGRVDPGLYHVARTPEEAARLAFDLASRRRR